VGFLVTVLPYIRAVKKRNRKPLNNYSKIVQFAPVCVVLLFTFINKFQNAQTDYVTKKRDTNQVLDSSILRNLSWADYSRNYYNLQYGIQDQEYIKAKTHKNKLVIPSSAWATNESYWQAVYSEIVTKDYEIIEKIADSLAVIRTKQNLNPAEFANTIMTFVQDIDYAFVFAKRSCSEEPNTPCIDGQKFGLHTPTEFMYTLQGDCDTRALLLWGIYKHLGYDPKIAISEAYRHAMLLLNLPSSGSYMTQFGMKYYFWETTGKGWKLGILPPSTPNIKQWKIVL